MRKLLIGVCAIALVLASTSKEYKYIQNSTTTIYTNPLIEKDEIVVQTKENVEVISNIEYRHDPELFFSEYAEGSSNHKYLEIYNPTSETIDLSGYAFPNVSNAPGEPGVYEYWNSFTEGASIAPGDVYVICHGSADDFIQAECDQHHTYLSNGDDGFALVKGTEGMGNFDAIDWIGDWAGDPGSGWEVCGTSNGTKDHTLVRYEYVHAGMDWATSSSEEGCEWYIYDQNTWDYVGSHNYDGSTDGGGDPTCEDLGGFVDCESQCVDLSYLSWQGDGYCDDGAYGLYLNCPEYNCDDGDCGDSLLDDGTCGTADTCDEGYDCAGVCGGDSVLDCVGTCTSASTVSGWVGDGLCDDGAWGYDFQCADFNCDAGDCGTVVLDDGTCGFESCASAGLNEDCSGNCFDDYYLGWVGDGWCDDENSALNFQCEGWVWDYCDCGYQSDDADAPCYLEPDEAANLFFSEHAEGSSNNKYFEVYNASDEDVSLDGYAFVNCSNGCDDWEYSNSFAAGAVVAAGSTYTVCHSSADEDGIIPFCDETRTLYHNGDDTQGLMHVSSGTLLDIIGTIGDDPGSGWEVAGIANGTKDHTIVRKSEVTAGNAGYWEFSSGSDADDSEWVVFDQNTWNYIGSHPHDFSSDVPGCTDTEACNFNADATLDDGTCLYNDCAGECGGSATLDACGECNGDGSSCGSEPLFFSEAAEGSSNNKYLEIYNPTDATVSLSGYAFPSSSNGSDGNYEYWNSFSEGAEVAAGDVYVICHGSASDEIQAECDGYHTYLSNGDDGYCLVFGNQDGFEVLDCVGDWGDDPGSGWDVAGISAATKDHTIVRKADVTSGNAGMWEASAGTSDDDSEWVVLDQNDWTYLGSHPHDFSVATCDDEAACNTGAEGDCTYAEENYDCEGNCTADVDCDGVCGGSAVEDDCGECNGDGSSCACDYNGDANSDGNLNVTDIVLVVGFIINGNTSDDLVCTSDVNMDGVVNVTDIVQMVSAIVNG